MADENPPLIPPAMPKKETVRITLPPKTGDAAKNETVRINVAGQAATQAGPKKETTRLPEVPAVPPPASPFSSLPPPKPLGTTPPLPGIKPLSVGGAPKPPTLGPRPTVPLKPSPTPSAPATGGSVPPTAGVKPATAPAGKAPLMPKATVRMQPTQQLVPTPPVIRTAGPGTGLAAGVGTADSTVEAADPMLNTLSWVAAAAAIFGLIGCVMAYLA